MVIEDVFLDSPGEGEVLVEIKATGLCHTDLSMLEGDSPIPVQWPTVLGHEAAGIVIDVGPGVQDLRPGDHVISYAAECRVCRSCHSPKGNYCEEALSGLFGPPTITVGGKRAF